MEAVLSASVEWKTRETNGVSAERPSNRVLGHQQSMMNSRLSHREMCGSTYAAAWDDTCYYSLNSCSYKAVSSRGMLLKPPVQAGQ